eukprot:maker-scaffold_8-snap-gene-5.3-mRNA-1 protein AED:0.00 eAED:0.00 QI:10/1/1/1/1/1/2/29/181
MTSEKEKGVNFKKFLEFPPFYTLQPVAETQRKQLQHWISIIRLYLEKTKETEISRENFPLFKNKNIQREADDALKTSIFADLVSLEYARYVDSEKTRLKIFWKDCITLSIDLHGFCSKHELVENLFTLYELHSGDTFSETDFSSLDSILCLKILKKLESQRKAIIYENENIDEIAFKILRT